MGLRERERVIVLAKQFLSLKRIYHKRKESKVCSPWEKERNFFPFRVDLLSERGLGLNSSLFV